MTGFQSITARGGRRPRSVLAAGVCVAGVLLSGCSGSSHPASSRAADSYGALPTYLPKSAITPDGRLTGSAHDAALTSEGDTVTVLFRGGTVLARVVGPVVPGEGLPYQPGATTCTWTVTLWHSTVRVPIRTRDFTTLDEDGSPYQVNLAPNAAPPPAALTPGARATFRLRAVMKTGEGIMRWAPAGRLIVAKWDFVVEND